MGSPDGFTSPMAGATVHTMMRRLHLVTPRRLLALVLVASVALVSLLSGRPYLWCIPMQQIMETACDVEQHQDALAHGPAVRATCCEERALGELPRADTRLELPHVLPAPVAFASLPPVVDAPRFRWAYLSPVRSKDARPGSIRAGPCSSADRCIALQVFRC
jgi:hypothetical protein